MKALRILTFVLLSLSLTSCIEFERQSMTYHYDSDKDELRIFQVYEGIYARGDEGKLTEKEKNQLAEVITGQRTFFFSNWILEFDKKQLELEVAQIKEEPDIAHSKEKLEFLERAIRSVKITNGEFYLNDKTELCAYQKVTISNASQLVDTANRLLSMVAQDVEWTEYNPKARAQIMKLSKDSNWIELTGNKVVVRFPQSLKEHFNMRREIADSIQKNTSTFFVDLLNQDILMSYREPILELTLGSKGANRTQIGGALSKGEYNTLVLDHVRETYAIQEKVEVEKVRDKFFKAE